MTKVSMIIVLAGIYAASVLARPHLDDYYTVTTGSNTTVLNEEAGEIRTRRLPDRPCDLHYLHGMADRYVIHVPEGKRILITTRNDFEFEPDLVHGGCHDRMMFYDSDVYEQLLLKTPCSNEALVLGRYEFCGKNTFNSSTALATKANVGVIEFCSNLSGKRRFGAILKYTTFES